MASRNGGREDAAPGGILLVVHDFVARSPDELSLTKGDRIELIERDDDFGDGWFLGRHMTNGNTGLFPEGAHSHALPKKPGQVELTSASLYYSCPERNSLQSSSTEARQCWYSKASRHQYASRSAALRE